MLQLCERPKRIGAKLRAIRQHLGLSQTEMKNRIGFPGEYGRISEYERGKRVPGFVVLLSLRPRRKSPVGADRRRRTRTDILIFTPRRSGGEETGRPMPRSAFWFCTCVFTRLLPAAQE